MNVLSGDLIIGTAMIENLVIRPGNNSITIRGNTDLATIIHNLPKIIQDQRQNIRNGYLALTTRVTNITYEGTVVPYYTNAMGELPLTAQIPILGLIINTIKTFLASPAAASGQGLLGAMNLTGILNETSSAGGGGGGLGSLLNITSDSALEGIAKRGLEHLLTL